MISGWNEGDPPRFKAVLSDSTIDARDRLDILGPVYNMMGDLVANDADELWSGAHVNPVLYTVDGVELGLSGRVWTGTRGDGTTSGANCTDWCDVPGNTSVGIPNQTSASWLQSLAFSCAGEARLYGISQIVVPEPATSLLLATAALALLPTRLRRPT